MTMPEAVVVSASLAWTRMRSSSGLIATCVAVVTGIPSKGIELVIECPVKPSSRVPAPAGLTGTLDTRVLIGGYVGG
jgi:hypothetical protein